MRAEINRNFYCSANAYKHEKGDCFFSNGTAIGWKWDNCRNSSCPHYHRKWPTPEQFEEEYGVKYPERGGVYYTVIGSEWMADNYWYVLNMQEAKAENIVCACTPWGMPPDTWRPE